MSASDRRGRPAPPPHPSGARPPAIPAQLVPRHVALVFALLSGDWATAEASGAAARREASGLVAAHLQWHLERGLRSLPLVERVRPS